MRPSRRLWFRQKEQLMSLILKAARYAASAHRGQMRKYGHSDRPYITHPARVAGRVAIASGATEEMVAAAWLHDVIEDCGVSEGELLVAFGNEVSKLVAQMTNPSKKHPELNRARRKAMDLEHIAEVGREAKVIKLADRVDNLRESLDDPETPPDFFKLYRAESRALIEALRGVDSDLERELEELL